MRSFPAGIFAPAIAATGAMPRSRVQGLKSSNAPGRIRTSDQQLRRLLLYPPELRARDCAATTYGAVLHRASKQWHKQCQNLMLPCPEAQGRELLLQDLLVLLHTILHHLGAMPHRTEVPVDPFHQASLPCPSSRLTVKMDTGAPWSVVWSRALAYVCRKILGVSSPAFQPARTPTASSSFRKVCQHRLRTRSERRE